MLEDEIEQDALVFFDKIEGLSYRDKVSMLKLILSKYALLSVSDCMLGRSDLLKISSMAKGNMAKDQATVHLGEKRTKLNFEEVRMMNITNAVISVLNGKDCFKRLPKFDKRTDEYQDGDV